MFEPVECSIRIQAEPPVDATMVGVESKGTYIFGCVIAIGLASMMAVALAKPIRSSDLSITYPIDGAVFPADIASPLILWEDLSETPGWRVTLRSGRCEVVGHDVPAKPEWRIDAAKWETLRECSGRQPIMLAVRGFPSPTAEGGDEEHRSVSEDEVSFRFSEDPVDAPIFYREVPLPFSKALAERWLIRWRFGSISSESEPRTVLEGMFNCANCHSFTADGGTIAMDLDYGRDKGSYAIAAIEPELELTTQELISWRDYRREDKHPTFGLLSQISPDGRYVVSTVKEVSVLRPLPDIYASQLFFPARGILAVYDCVEERFFALPGADDPDFVQTSPAWSPDGRWVVFAKAPAVDLEMTQLPTQPALKPEIEEEFVRRERTIRYDLYRVPFNDGKGGTATPIRGAHGNGLSNFFPKFSPDGRWIVFCQAEFFMFNQPDSRLAIIPSGGGDARTLNCNAPGRMNSWHSWSPNGRWLAYSSKANGPYTQIWLTHIDTKGGGSRPVVLDRFTPPDRAANLPEFVNAPEGALRSIKAGPGVRGTGSREMPTTRR